MVSFFVLYIINLLNLKKINVSNNNKKTAHKFNIPQNVLHKNVKKITDTILFNYGQNV